jgi:hypothetical protein
MLKRVVRIAVLAFLFLGTCSTLTLAVSEPPTPLCPPNWPYCPMAAPPAPPLR